MENRIVRFRCWDMKTKQWKRPARNIYTGFEVNDPGSRWVFTEFSNYKTPKGTDIFEGDIIEYVYNSEGGKLVGICVKGDNGFTVGFNTGLDTMWDVKVSDLYLNCQVIGNIFTGPQIEGLT